GGHSQLADPASHSADVDRVERAPPPGGGGAHVPRRLPWGADRPRGRPEEEISECGRSGGRSLPDNTSGPGAVGETTAVLLFSQVIVSGLTIGSLYAL